LGPYHTFVSSDILSEAFLRKSRKALRIAKLLKREMDKLDVKKGEKLATTNFAISDVVTEAVSKHRDASAVAKELLPGYSPYLWPLQEDSKTLDNARTCLVNYPRIRLTLSEWIALHIMAKNEIRLIVSSNREIDKAFVEPSLRDLFKGMARVHR
jgi:hypothetical protein